MTQQQYIDRLGDRMNERQHHRHSAEFRNREQDYTIGVFIGAVIGVIGGGMIAVAMELMFNNMNFRPVLMIGVVLLALGGLLFLRSAHLRSVNRAVYQQLTDKPLFVVARAGGWSMLRNVRDPRAPNRHEAMDMTVDA